MKLHRFFVEQSLNDSGEVVIRDNALYHQIRNVFRFTIGGQVILLDNSGYEYHAMVSAFGHGEISFSIVSKREGKNISETELCLFCSVIKKDNFEWVIEKGTELGVSCFVPIISDRSEKKSLNYERLEKIIKESSEQSGRTIKPTVEEVTNFEEAIKREIPKVTFDPKGEMFVAERILGKSLLGIFIGPEGGWTEREIFLFKQNSVPIYSLGTQILRAETASIAIASLVLLQ